MSSGVRAHLICVLQIADSSRIETGESEFSIFCCSIQATPLCPFLKAGIGFKLRKTSFFHSGGISADAIKLQISHSQERVRAGVGKSCYVCAVSLADPCGGPGHSAAAVCCDAWCDLSAVTLLILAGWLGMFLCTDFVFLDKISCKCSGSFSSVLLISSRCEAMMLVVKILKGVFTLSERQLKLVACGVRVFFSVKEIIIVSTESVPSQVSERNIEVFINTYTCKISITFFFSVLFCCVKEGLSGLCFICLFLLLCFICLFLLCSSDSCILLIKCKPPCSHFSGFNLLCWCLCVLFVFQCDCKEVTFLSHLWACLLITLAGPPTEFLSIGLTVVSKDKSFTLEC